MPGLAGPPSAALFADLIDLPVADVADDALVGALSAGQRLIGAVTAQMLVATAELHDRRVGPLASDLARAQAGGDAAEIEWALHAWDIGGRAVRDEVALELMCSRTMAGHHVETALTLTRDLPRTLDALAAGELEPRKASVVADLLGAVDDDEIRRKLEDLVLRKAWGWTLPTLREEIKKLTLKLDPGSAAENHEKARTARRVGFTPADDDMMELWALLPADDGARLRSALDIAADAARAPGDQRTSDQRRLDALVDVVCGAVVEEGAHLGEHDIKHPGNCCADPERPEQSERPERPARSVRSEQPARSAQSEQPARSAQSEQPAGSAQSEQSEQPERSAQSARSERSDQLDSAPEADHGAASAAAGGADPPGVRVRTEKEQAAARKQSRRRARRGLRHEVQVVVPFETITGDADEPGYLARYGPISSHLARKMAWQVADQGVWRCVVTDDVHGTVLGLGSSTFSPGYESSDRLRRLINARDRHCTFPGCRAAAAVCDKDHQVPWPEGATCECHLYNRCPHHHRVKHETSFAVRFSDDPEHPPGTVIWTSPTGREYPEFPAVVGVPKGQSRVGRTRLTGRDGSEREGWRDPGPPPF